MERQVGNFPVWSIRFPDDRPEDCPAPLMNRVSYLPDSNVLDSELSGFRSMMFKYPIHVILAVKFWGHKKDRLRLLEAAWLGLRLKAQDVDHVHTHFAGISARTAWWIKKFYGITYSFTAHANDIFCLRDKEKVISLEALIRDSRFVVTVSDFSLSWLNRYYGEFSEKFFRVYNGFDFDVNEQCDSLAVETFVPMVLSIGRLIEKKGFEDLVDACSLLRDLGVDFCCKIVGDGPLKKDLNNQISRLNLSGYVELCGGLPQHLVRQLLDKSSVFVLACVPESDGGMDNLPTVIVEAMAFGLPVVSTPLAAIPEMVLDGETGFLVSEHSPAELAEAIKTLLTDPSLSRHFGDAGLRLGRQKFSLPFTVSELRGLIQSSR